MNQTKHRILICSPNANFLEDYRSQLDSDFDLQVATTEEICNFLAKDWKPHIAVIDGDQFGNMTTHLRQNYSYSSLGIVVVAEKEGIFKEEFAFRSGADHFVGQLSDYKSLVWRVISLVRKMQTFGVSTSNATSSDEIEAPSSITLGTIKIYPKDYLVKCNGRVVKVTPIQFKLLLAFITHSDQLLTRNWIKDNIWENAEISPRSIDAQISKLKKVVPEIGRNIINVYGQGYILTPEQSSAA